MGVKKGEVSEGYFMLKADPCGRKQTDGKGGSKNFLLEVYVKELCHKISQNSDSGNYQKIEWNTKIKKEGKHGSTNLKKIKMDHNNIVLFENLLA